MDDFLSNLGENVKMEESQKSISIEAVMVNLSDLSIIFDFYYKLCNEQLESLEEHPNGVSLKFDQDFIKFVSDDHDIN